MSQFWKFSSILAVLALLVVMGLSTQPTVDAQTVPTGKQITGSGGTIYICTTGTATSITPPRTPPVPTTCFPLTSALAQAQ